MKVIINKCFGGFSLSHEAMLLYFKKKNIEVFPYKTSEDYVFKNDYIRCEEGSDPWLVFYSKKDLGDNPEAFGEWFYDGELERHDPDLVAVVEELGEKANGSCSELVVVSIPNVAYEIEDYDGLESIVAPKTYYG